MKILHDKELDERQKSSQEIFKGNLLHVFKDTVTLPNGNESGREYIKHPGAIAVIPVLPDGSMVFVKQYRYPVGTVLYEIPAGKLDPGEDPLHCAVRELSEETGYEAGTWEYLTSIVTTPGFSDEVIHLYAARDLTKKQQHCDEDEFISLQVLSPQQVREMVLQGDIYDGKTLAALLLYLLQREN